MLVIELIVIKGILRWHSVIKLVRINLTHAPTGRGFDSFAVWYADLKVAKAMSRYVFGGGLQLKGWLIFVSSHRHLIFMR